MADKTNNPEDNLEQAAADLTVWHSFISTLPWRRGSLDDSSFKAALRAASLKIPQQMVLDEICCRIARAGDYPNTAKVSSQISRACGHVSGTEGQAMVRTPKASFRVAALRRVAENFQSGDVREFLTSRSALPPEQVTSEAFLKALYAESEKIVVFTVYESQGQALWPDCGDQLPTGGKDGVWFLVNPVDGRYRQNPRQGGKPSRRSQESVTSFRFAVLESDQADLTDWLKCLAQMPLPIAAIYESGARSIHALVQVDAKTKEEWDEKMRPIKPRLITLGADPGALSAVRLSRLPQAKRGERLQKLLYLKPNPDDVPIVNKPAICKPKEQENS